LVSTGASLSRRRLDTARTSRGLTRRRFGVRPACGDAERFAAALDSGARAPRPLRLPAGDDRRWGPASDGDARTPPVTPGRGAGRRGGVDRGGLTDGAGAFDARLLGRLGPAAWSTTDPSGARTTTAGVFHAPLTRGAACGSWPRALSSFRRRGLMASRHRSAPTPRARERRRSHRARPRCAAAGCTWRPGRCARAHRS
jgi:hypothetical protein